MDGIFSNKFFYFSIIVFSTIQSVKPNTIKTANLTRKFSTNFYENCALNIYNYNFRLKISAKQELFSFKYKRKHGFYYICVNVKW